MFSLLPRQPRLDFERWRQTTLTTLGASSEDASDVFGARLYVSRAGDLSLVRYEASPHRMERTRRQVEQNDSRCYLVSLQVEGTSVLRQGTSEIIVRAGEAAAVDCRRPSALHMVTAGRRIAARLPGDFVSDRIGHAKWIGLRRLDGQALLAIFNSLAKLSPSPGNLLADQLAANAMADLIAASPRVAPGGPHLMEVLLIDYLERNYRDPCLSPADAAAHLGISVRAVHKKFDRDNTTLGAWLRTRRLKACFDALAEAQGTTLLISDIALSNGFNDVSHFNHAFKARYGLPPRAVQRRLQEGDGRFISSGVHDLGSFAA